MTWTLYEGDNLAIMPTIQDKSIDLIIIDPPYNIGKAEWDKIPDYVEWLGARFKECERVLKDNGSFYWFHNDFLQIVDLQKWIQQNTVFIFKQFITWLKIDPRFKNSGFAQQRLSNGTMRNYYDGFTEYCLFYTFQDKTGLEFIDKEYIAPRNPFRKELIRARQETGMTIKEVAEMGRFYGNVNHGGAITNWEQGYNIPLKEQWEKLKTFLPIHQEYEDLRREYEAARYPFNMGHVITDFYGNSNVWRYHPAPQIGHVTPKPTNLLENIILHSSNPGDLILDCFAGSGTTGIAAENLGRNSIMIEQDPKYCNIIRNRMANRQTTIFEEGVNT